MRRKASSAADKDVLAFLDAWGRQQDMAGNDDGREHDR
jgi:hypothetical protein